MLVVGLDTRPARFLRQAHIARTENAVVLKVVGSYFHAIEYLRECLVCIHVVVVDAQGTLAIFLLAGFLAVLPFVFLLQSRGLVPLGWGTKYANHLLATDDSFTCPLL